MTQTIITTLGSTSWTVPAGVSSIQAECIGGGAGGWTTNELDYGAGGGGGSYAKTNSISVTPGQTVYLFVGAGGGANTNGGDSWVNKAANSAPASTTNGALAKGGSASADSGVTGGVGGAAASCIGNTTYSGGNGGGAAPPTAFGSGGGGGAAGPSGAGKAGGSCPTGFTDGGGGGGGSNGGSSTAGTSVTAGSATGGAGGNGTGGTGGGASNGGAGSAGGGGGGGNGGTATGTTGGAGGSDTAFDASHGSGGGGGGGGYGTSTAGSGGAGGAYGGGGGGSAWGEVTLGSGGTGGNGIIVLTYTATAQPTPEFSEFFSPKGSKLTSASNWLGQFSYERPTATTQSFQDWGASQRIVFPAPAFNEGSFYEPPLPATPVYGGAFGEWWPVPYKAPQGQEFPSQYLYPPPRPLEPLCFDPWPPAHKIIHSPVDFGLFAIRPVEILIPDPSDAVRRPNKKISRKSRFEYSIYNHPPFDVIYEEYQDVTLTEDELDEARLQAIDSLLAELSVSHPEDEPTEQVIPPDSLDVIAVEIDVDPEFGAQREVLHALAAQQRAIEDRLDVADLMAPQMVNVSEIVGISDVVGGVKPTVELNAAVDLSILRVQKDGVDVMSAIESFIFGDKS